MKVLTQEQKRKKMKLKANTEINELLKKKVVTVIFIS